LPTYVPSKGPLGLGMGTSLWVMRLVGTITRGTMYSACYALSTLFGFRSFLAIATKRVSGLKSVAKVQSAVRGTNEDKVRRKGILHNKIGGLVLDLTGVLINSVFLTASFVIFGSTKSSRQYVVHTDATNFPIALFATLFLAATHVKLTKKRKARRRPCKESHASSTGRADTGANSDGTSVQSQSSADVVTSSQANARVEA
jgi:hypothetical protein